MAVRIIATIACLATLYFGSSVFIPVTSGFFLFFLLDPIVDWSQEKYGIGRNLSSTVLVIFSLAASGALIWILYSAIADIAREVPSYSKELSGIIQAVEEKADSIRNNTSKVLPHSQNPSENESKPESKSESGVEKQGERNDQSKNQNPNQNQNSSNRVQKVQIVGGEFGKITGFALRGLGTIVDLLATAFFVPLIALFLLFEKKERGPMVVKLFKKPRDSQIISTEISRMLKGFFIGNLVIGIVMAILLIILFSIIGLRNSVSLGLIAGFLNLIPLVGPLIAVVLPIAEALLQFHTPAPFILIAGFIIFLHFATANFIVPRFVGSHVNVNATASTISLLIWGFLWGAIGVLFAIPLTGLLRIFLENYKPTEPMAKLLEGETSYRRKSS